MADPQVQRFEMNFSRYVKGIDGLFTMFKVPANRQAAFLTEILRVVDTRDRTGEWEWLKGFMQLATGSFGNVLPTAQQQMIRSTVNLLVLIQYLRPSRPLPANGPAVQNFHRIDTTVWRGDTALMPQVVRVDTENADMMACASKWQQRLTALGPWIFVQDATKKRLVEKIEADLKAGFGRF